MLHNIILIPFNLPKACNFPEWKSSSSCNRLCSICLTSALSVKNECSLHERLLFCSADVWAVQ